MPAKEAGSLVLRYAMKYGIYKFIGPYLKINKISFTPIRRKSDDHDEAGAILYEAEVENVGSKTATNCRPYLEADIFKEFDPEDESTLVEEYEDITNTEENIQSVKFSFENNVFWSDGIGPRELIKEEIDTVCKRNISPGEKANFAFAVLIAGHGFRFLGPGGYNSPNIPDIKINNKAWTPAHEGNNESLGLIIPLDVLKEVLVQNASIYVVCEEIPRISEEFDLIFDEDDKFNINIRS